RRQGTPTRREYIPVGSSPASMPETVGLPLPPYARQPTPCNPLAEFWEIKRQICLEQNIETGSPQ
ncbi:hypothetical protein, partial [Halopseudomonas laoshanensis]|uniref:hypothetical protein n=1 Tax=Halopseudomonas laoshanensis TaxID=2268758 RepID=UPI001C49C66E